MRRRFEDRELWERLDNMDAEMARDGIEDATAWCKWDEYEKVLYAIAEREAFRASALREQRMRDFDDIIELVEVAEEAALSELAAFGTIEPPEMGAMWGGVLRRNAIAESFAGVFGMSDESFTGANHE